MYQKKKEIEKILILLMDLTCITISTGISYYLRFGTGKSAWLEEEGPWFLAIMLITYVGACLILGFYHHFFRRGYFEELLQVLRSESIVFLIVLALLYLIHRSEELPRLMFGYLVIVNTVLMYVFRLLFKQFMIKGYRRSKYSSRLLVVTDSRQAEKVLKNILPYNEWYRQVTGIALTDESDMSEVGGVPVVAHAEDLLEYVIHNSVDEVFIIDRNLNGTELLREWTEELEQMGINININIDEFDIGHVGTKTLNRVGKYAVVTFARNIFSNRQLVLKRTLDIVGSLVGMVLLCIMTVFVAPAIMIDSPGPVFFGQTRIGKNGRRFTFYKFRSMYIDAEERKKELLAQNEVKGPMFKMEDDPRITKVGKFLRKTSIDEMPQFWNVLRGDMSLVGTRPPTVDELEHYEAQHRGRLSMTPGLTGLWQISGRSDITDFDEVVRLDMEYIDDWTIWKDIKILLLTVKVVITGKGSK